MPVPLRTDFDAAALRAITRQHQGWPAGATVSWHWPRSMMAARGRMRHGSAGSGCRSCATGLSVSTPMVLRAWSTAKRRSALPASSTRVARPCWQGRCGPIPALHGVVRWRLIDLAQWLFEEFRVSISKPTLSRELRHMGFRKLSARPRHHAKTRSRGRLLKNFLALWRRPPQKRLRWQADRDLVSR